MQNQITPYPHQIKMADEGFNILSRYGLCYNVSQERVGKSLATILMVERSSVRQNCLILTKKAAVPDWRKLINNYRTTKNYFVINYESAHKIPKDFHPDIAVLDEAHHGLGAYPKPSKMLLSVGELLARAGARTGDYVVLSDGTKQFGLPLIYLSATPHAESYSQLYHQLRLSPWSPFREYRNFYRWHAAFGIPKTQYLGSRSIQIYSETKDDLIKPLFDNISFGLTRKQAGFTEEAEDIIHYIPLSEPTLSLINNIRDDQLVECDVLLNHTESIAGDGFECEPLAIESASAEYTKIHQIEGGTIKYNDKSSLLLKNTEKIDYILDTFGDNKDTVIMYHYQAEFIKLSKYFQHVTILQADRFAEGISLKDYKTLIIYSMSWRTSKYIQRRSRQADFTRKTPIKVHYILCKDALSDDVYTCVAKKNINFNSRNAKLLNKD